MLFISIIEPAERKTHVLLIFTLLCDRFRFGTGRYFRHMYLYHDRLVYPEHLLYLHLYKVLYLLGSLGDIRVRPEYYPGRYIDPLLSRYAIRFHLLDLRQGGPYLPYEFLYCRKRDGDLPVGVVERYRSEEHTSELQSQSNLLYPPLLL